MRLRYIHIAVIFISSPSCAQDLHNNTSIFIPNNISVYAGDVDNRGFIQNNGTIEVTGNWNNRDVYQGLGTIILSGRNQEIDNNNQAIENLLIDGGGKKSLEGKVTINGSLELVSGIIEIKNGNELLIDGDASIEGGSSSSFVEGSLTIEGTGYKFFPVGVKNTYYPITLTQVRGLKPVLTITSFKDLPAVTTLRTIEVNNANYWTVEVAGGSYQGSPVMIPNTMDEERIAFITANDLEDEFKVIEAEVDNSSIMSKEEIKRSIIATGIIPPEPIKAGYLSTSMSPNAHNADNRAIRIFGTEMSDTNFSFFVFNRFGNTVFESRSLSAMTTDGWDGTFNGQFVPAGAYPYKLTYVDYEGREMNKTGFITIVY